MSGGRYVPEIMDLIETCMKNKKIRLDSLQIRIVFYIALASMPFILTAVQSVLCRQNLFFGRPHNSDELCYWRVLYSFSECGFDFASTCGFLNCEAPVGPLGEHGLATLFSWWGILFGTVTEYSLFWWNLFILSVALAVFVAVNRPDTEKVVWVAALLAGNGVLIEQWHSHMMEIPCLAIILIYFSLQLAYERTHNKYLFILLAGCAVYASFMRICYIIIFFPTIMEMCMQKKNKKRSFVISMLIYIGFFCVIRKFEKMFMKSSQSFLTNVNVSNGIIAKVRLLCSNFEINIKRYFNLYSGTPVEVGQRYFQIILMLFLLLAAFLRVEDHKFKIKFQMKYFAQLIALGSLIFMIVVLYDVNDWRDVRTTMPYAAGVAIWFIANSIRKHEDRCLKLLFFICCFFTLFQFAPAKYMSNHPADRYILQNTDDDWIEQIPNENIIFCLYNSQLENSIQFQLYQKLPPKIGIQIATSLEDIREADQIDYLLTSEEIESIPYELINISEDYGYLYSKIR